MNAPRTTDADVLVIGGGPCGSTAAAFARQAGMSVIVVEKDAFPRFHIGESLLPNANAVLRRSGAWNAVASAGFVVKRGARFCTADGLAHKRVDFGRGLVPGLDATFQVERAKFDALLLEHARALGADVRQGWKVVELLPGDAGVEARLESVEGGQRVVRAAWCIDAGGRENHYANALKRETDPPRLARRVAVYSHFEGMVREEAPAGGDTIVVRLDDGWFWIIPLAEGKTSVGLVTTTDTLRCGGRDPEEVFRRTVEDSPYLRERFRAARATMGFHVTADYSYFRRELARGRCVLAGDAGGFFDPIFSSGVYMSLWGAEQAVRMVARAHGAGRSLGASECARYTRRVKRHAGVFARLIESFYDNAAFSVFMTPRPPFDLERGINSIVAGHAALTFGQRWRLAVFELCCRIQRRRPLVPEIRIPTRVAASGRAPDPEATPTGELVTLR
jgi:flavin-dependent dehydrogenase